MLPEVAEALVWVNGERGATVDARDRGLAFGDGVFESMRYGAAGVFLLEYHLARLQQGARQLKLSLDLGTVRSDVAAALLAVRDSQPRGVLKLVVTRGVSPRGYRVTPNVPCTRILTVSSLPENPSEWGSEGVSVRFCDVRMGTNAALAGAKHLNRLEQVMARLEWDDPAIAEGLLSDARGRIVEGVSTNLFLVSGGRILTPVIDTCGVSGVMRQYIIEKAPEIAGQSVEVVVCEKGMLTGARELFLCNSVIGVWPVSRLGDRKIPVGSITRRIRDHVAQLFAG